MAMLEQSEFLSRINMVRNVYRLTKKRQNKEQYLVYEIPAAFDIEVSSFYENDEKRCIMYIWMFGIDKYVTYGRTWEEYHLFISRLTNILHLSSNRRLYVYVHNLQYEFQFIRKQFYWEKVFQLESRVPAYALTDGIEYRCSLKLSGGKSLENVGKDLRRKEIHGIKIEKKKGYLDYSIIRSPLTSLTSEELEYCEMDIRILLEYIREKIEDDTSIIKIPLTNTGYVRQYMRDCCFKHRHRYKKVMEHLTLDTASYISCVTVFMGGFTHGNPAYVPSEDEIKSDYYTAGYVLNNISSIDFASSYPAVMALDYFPMSKFKLVTLNYNVNDINGLKQFKNILNNYCCLFTLEVGNIKPKLKQDYPISSSKCDKGRGTGDLINGVIANGRVVSADYLKTECTELDFDTYTKFYVWDTIKVSNLRIARRGFLPTQFIKGLLKLYKDKTSLKGLTDPLSLVNYMISKNMINSAYGMMVTSIIRDVLEYHNEPIIGKDGKETNYSKEVIRNSLTRIEDEIEKYNKKYNRFLYYPWGIWVTAHARHHLFEGIIEFGDDYIYSDTDSIKAKNYELHKEWVQKYNDNILKKIKKASNYHAIPIDDFMPVSQKGKQCPLGIWDFEGTYKRFISLGAKRYLVQLNDDVYKSLVEKGERIYHPYQLTVSGLSKKNAIDYMVFGRTIPESMSAEEARQLKQQDPFDMFKPGLTIPGEYSGRLTVTYLDDEMEGDITDCQGNDYHYHELSGVHMEPQEYRMSMSRDFLNFLRDTHIEDIT